MSTPANPFGRPLPVVVLLRNRQKATVTTMVTDCPPFHLLGKQGATLVDARAVELWRLDGRWSEDGKTHSLDIIGVAIDQEAMKFEPFAAAAGTKGQT